MSEPVTITLSKPIQAHNQTLAQLTLRTPNGGDIRRNGYPFTMRDGLAGEAITENIAGYVRDLAQIPLSSVDQLAPQDFLTATLVVISFFMPQPVAAASGQAMTPPNSSPSTTASPASTGTIPASLG